MSEQRHPDIVAGSTLHILGFFLDALRARFSPNQAIGLGWYWNGNPVPADTTSSDTPPSGAPKKLFIGMQYDLNEETRDYRPALLLDRGNVQYTKEVLGNLAAHNYDSGDAILIATKTMTVAVNCLSRAAGEAVQLADVIADFLFGHASELRKHETLQSVGEPVIGECTSYQAAQNQTTGWSVTVSMLCNVRVPFVKTQIAPLLQQATIQFHGATSQSGSVGIDEPTED